MANFPTDGDDVITGFETRDTISAKAGDDTVKGLGGNDFLNGDAGDDILDGGNGNDQLTGGEGRDKLVGADGNDVLVGDNGDDALLGGAGRDVLIAGNGNDFLDGGAGDDILDFSKGAIGVSSASGGTGNDTFIFNGPLGHLKSIDGGTGRDIISLAGSLRQTYDFSKTKLSSVAIQSTGQKVVLKTTQVSALDLSNTVLPDLKLATGGTLTLHNKKELKIFLFELNAAGNKLDLTGSSSIGNVGFKVLGSNKADVILGGTKKDNLKGQGGKDTLNGYAGNDILNGGADNDVLVGGGGKDTYTGGAGADRFTVNDVYDSTKGSARDAIKDFSHSQHDKIDLSKIDADISKAGDQKFTFIGSEGFHSKGSAHVYGELRYANHVLSGDIDGNGRADFEIHVNVTKLIDGSGGDFVL